MSFKLTVAQVDKNVFQGEVTQVTCPTQSGDVTILGHHAPLVAPLRPGEIRIVNAQGSVTTIPAHFGVLEVADNEATVLL